MAEVKKITVRTLSDLPARSDAFGPHKRIAQAIYSVIEEESGNKAIALTGSWGSGKSTVINILDDQLKHPNETIYVFDAWSHQGDPLRRSFLEGFIDHLEEIGWSPKGNWKTEKENISRRREESETIVTPGLSIYGKSLAFSALFVPAGLALMSKHGFLFDQPPNIFIEVLPSLLTFLPLVAGLAIWVALRPWKKLWSWQFLTTNRPPFEDESLYTILKSDTKEITKNVTAKTPDPTSLEFNDLFGRILDDALTSSSRKLIIVMDNLDRIDPDAAISVWATMRIFFDHNRVDQSQSRSRFWLIVPFDFEAIESLWETDGNNKSADIAKSFIDKSFQLTFHVSPPVLSDWKEFLFAQLGEAFPEHDKNDFHSVYRIYLLSDRQPSPRDIKIFVNEIGAIYRQRGGEIPFVLQAAFVLNRNGKSEQAISDGSFISKESNNVIGILDWQKYIAALHFNVELDKALQVLLRPDIERAFAKGDPDLLKSARDVPAFEENCEDLITTSVDGWAKDEPPTIPYAAHVLDSLGVISTPSANRSWSDLRKGCLNVKAWAGIRPDNSINGIKLLIKSASSHEIQTLVEAILKGFASLTPGNEKSGEKKSSPEWLMHSRDAIAPIIETIVDLGLQDQINKHFFVPGDSNVYIEVLHKIGSNRPSSAVLKTFKSKNPEKNISETLCKLINENNFSPSHSEVVESLHIIGFADWASIVQAIQARLNPQTGLNGSQASGLIKSLLYLDLKGRNTDAQKCLSYCNSESFIQHFLHLFNSEKNDGGQADAVLILMLHNPGGSLAKNVGNSNAGNNHYNQVRSTPEKYDNIIERLADLVLEFELSAKFIEFLSSGDVSKLATLVLKKCLVSRKAHQYVNSDLLCEKAGALYDALDRKDFEKVVFDLAENSNLVEEIIKNEFKIELESVYKALSESGNPKWTAELNKFLVEGLQKVDEGTWKTQLANEGDLIDVGIAVTASGHELNLEDAFADPYLELSKVYRKKSQFPEWLGPRWAELSGFLDTSFRETFYRDVVHDLVSNPKIPISTTVQLLGPELKKSVATEEKADDLYRIVAKEVLERAQLDSSEIIWLAECLQGNSNIASQVKDSTKSTLNKRIANLLKDGGQDEAVQNALIELNKHLRDGD